MVEKIDKVLEVVFEIMKVILIILLVSMVGILIAHIWFRYVVNNSLTWSEELLKILLVWFGMLSVAVLAARREHVAIVIFKEKLMPKKLAKACDIITQALTVAICIVGIWLGISYCMSAGFRLTPALRIPYTYAYLAIPVAFFFVSLFEIRNLLADITKKGNYACIEKPEEDLTGGTEVEL